MFAGHGGGEREKIPLARDQRLPFATEDEAEELDHVRIRGNLGPAVDVEFYGPRERIGEVGDVLRRGLDKGTTLLHRERHELGVGVSITRPGETDALQVGADRILFSTDYPFEEMQEPAEWFETLPIAETDKLKIARTNSARLFKLDRA